MVEIFGSMPFWIGVSLFASGWLMKRYDSKLPDWAQTFLAYLGVLLMIGGLIGAVVASYPQKEEGDGIASPWGGFIYNVPRHIRTMVIEAEDNGKIFPFEIKDAPPDSLVKVKIKYISGLGKLSLKGLVGAPYIAGTRESILSVRLDGNSTTNRIVVDIPPDSDDTIVYMYLLSWEP